VRTRFGVEKVLAAVEGTALGSRLVGYQIHHGRVEALDGSDAWLTLDGSNRDRPTIDGVKSGRVFGTTVHGVLDEDGVRGAFLSDVAERAGTDFAPGSLFPSAHRDAELDRLADHVEAHVDMAAIARLIEPR